ncbi:MAG: serine hydrolase domain-containing protein [Pseudomonadota bacterium]
MTHPKTPFLPISCIFLLAVSAAVNPARAASNLEAALQAVLEDALDVAPGAILSVSAPDLEFHEAVGLADRKAEIPMRADYTLRMGSITKTYVAALTIMAANEGLIDLDGQIIEYLCTDVLSRLPDGASPTIRQLLNHTSGIPDYYGVRFYTRDWKDRGPLTTELVLHAIRGKKMTGAPGEAFSYSNTNYHLIALILESVYSASLEALLIERLFAPLGLDETYYSKHFPPGDEIHGYGAPLRPWKDTYDWQENTGPDGGMFGTAKDVAVWIRALFAPDGRFSDIGDAMAVAPVLERERKEQGMGVEILVSRSGVRVMGHTGGLDGYMTAAFYIPEKDATLVLHINKTDEDGFSQILGAALRAIMAS